MKRTLALVAALTTGLVSIANADVQANADDAPANPLVTPWTRPQATYRFIDPGLPTLDDNNVAAATSNVIYLNNCKPNGCAVHPGDENSATGSSGIPSQNSTVQAFAYSDAVWNQVVDCVKQSYAPFAVNIVTTRPASGSYHMAIVAGRPQDVQMDAGVGGVSPFTCGYINNAISYSFANIYGPDVDQICWTVAQETAHSWGLDHKFDNKDPMTYLSSGPTRKAFQNTDGACGEFSARSCQCGGTKMNSFQEILATFGGSTPTPPTVEITSPKDGDTVVAGFPIRANITDDISVMKAELRIDGQLVSTLQDGLNIWVWNAPASVGQGTHTIKITGYDIAGTPQSDSVTVSIGAPCGNPSDCSRDTDTCVDGRCVPGEGVDGGLGTACTTGTGCASGQCAADADGNHYCVEQCDLSRDACPSGFDCIDGGGGNGVCWPGGGGGGGCSTNDNGGGMMLIAFGIGAVLVVRRRRG